MLLLTLQEWLQGYARLCSCVSAASAVHITAAAFHCAVQVILMDHVDWLDEAAASQLASRLADQASCYHAIASSTCYLVAAILVYATDQSIMVELGSCTCFGACHLFW